MGLRDSFSTLTKKVKRRLSGNGRRKPEGTRVDLDGERVNPTSTLPRPGLHVLADGRQSYSTSQPPQPDELESIPESGSDSEQGGESDGDGWEVSQRYSPPRSDDGLGAGSGLGQEGRDADGEEVERLFVSPSTPILCSKKPDST